MKKKIVVVGSLNLDLVANVERMPAEGETMLGQAFATYPGGKGANQAVAAAKLGGDVMMVGRLGNDLFAEELRRELSNAGVNARCVENVECASGSAVILVTPQGANSIVVIPGANATLRPQDLDDYTDVFSEAGVILSQLEIPLDTVERLGQIAAELGVPFVLDPAPVQAISPATLRCVTWLTPNETETQLLLQQLGHAMGEALSDAAVRSAAEHLLATGARNVILKLGSRGIYLQGADVADVFVAPFVVKAVDTTAAGDAFNGGFAFGLTRGMAPVDAAKFACAVAAVSVTRVGAQPSMPSLQEAESLLGASVAG